MIVIVVSFIKSSQEVSMGTPIPDYLEKNSALLVIDIQEATTGSVTTEHEYQNKASSLFFAVNNVIDSCELKNIPIIYIKNEITHPVINFLDNSMKKGSVGTQLDDRLTIASDFIFSKEKQDAFSNPDLDKLLSQLKISTLYITGLDAGFCVRSTCLAAINRNYKIVLIDDAIISESEDLKNKSFEELESKGANIVDSDSFLSIDY